jgi:hypothetical protein
MGMNPKRGGGRGGALMEDVTVGSELFRVDQEERELWGVNYSEVTAETFVVKARWNVSLAYMEDTSPREAEKGWVNGHAGSTSAVKPG